MTLESFAKTRLGRPKRSSSDQDGLTLTVGTIFVKSLALIDERGIANFNIRDLASTLGVTPAAIYWHVPNRNALISGAINLAFEGVAANLPGDKWQERLHSLLHAFRQVLRRHPNLAPFVAGEMAYNASFDAELLDEIVAILEDAGFAGTALAEAFNVVIVAMCGFSTQEMATPVSGQDWQDLCKQRINSVDQKRYRSLGRHLDVLANNALILRWSSGITQPLDGAFDMWVTVIIAGMEAMIQKQDSIDVKR